MDLRSLHQQTALLSSVTSNKHVLTKVDDDDCAVVKLDSDILVATTDFINSSPAIVELGNGSWHSLGQLVACHNLADLAGSGCIPRFFLSGVCAPMDTSREDLLDFTRGVCSVCCRYNCALIGGDTKFGRVRAIYGTALGTPMGACGPFLRTQAKPGYKIIVSGSIGSFAAAVACIGVGESIFAPSELARAREILFRTDIPFALAESIASCGQSCAGTDISDGLGTDVADICLSSSVAATITETSIPIDDFTHVVASRLDVPPWSFAFSSGGDFSCAFGVPVDVADACASVGGTVIGQFEQGPSILRSGVTGRLLERGGHTATRTQTFADEIIASVYRMKDFYGPSTY